MKCDCKFILYVMERWGTKKEKCNLPSSSKSFYTLACPCLGPVPEKRDTRFQTTSRPSDRRLINTLKAQLV